MGPVQLIHVPIYLPPDLFQENYTGNFIFLLYVNSVYHFQRWHNQPDSEFSGGNDQLANDLRSYAWDLIPVLSSVDTKEYCYEADYFSQKYRYALA